MDSSEASSAGLMHMGNAPFASDSEKVWIRNISSSEILFGLTLTWTLDHHVALDGGSESDAVNVNKTRPFYVRLNGASWSSVKIEDVKYGQDNPTSGVDVWLGKIFGLTAYSPYHIEFVRLDGDSLIYAASLITLPAPSTDQGEFLRSSIHLSWLISFCSTLGVDTEPDAAPFVT